MTSLDDQLYIRFRSDDYASFNQLFHRYYGRLCAYSFQIIQDKQAAEDLIQDRITSYNVCYTKLLRYKIKRTGYVGNQFFFVYDDVGIGEWLPCFAFNNLPRDLDITLVSFFICL